MHVVPHGGGFAAIDNRGNVVATGHLEIITSPDQLLASNGRRFAAPAMFVVDHVNGGPGPEPANVLEGGDTSVA